MFRCFSRFATLFIVLVFNKINVYAQLQVASCGRIERIENFASRYVSARNIDVWLPDGYDSGKKYDVLYMQDGQMLFDSSFTWTKSSWDVDDTAGRLLREGKIRNLIVVGIWNSGKSRAADYIPQKPIESLARAQQDSLYNAARNSGASVFNGERVHSDDYLKFIVLELKPAIDARYSTRKGRKHTFIAGSSMGGLISMYAICEYPDVFGGAACLSTHWPGIFTMENNPVPAAFFSYLKTHLPAPGKIKIYFDYGDQTLDALYPPLQKQADEIMRARGYTSKNWMTRYFPGENHSEIAWKKRFEIPLLFLSGRK